MLDEVLRGLDWSEWETHDSGWRGQPPIHPRVLGGIWLYAMLRRIHTSRPLEYACVYNVDFMWLAEGLVPDHSTLAEFFSKFRPELKSLFKQVGKIAMTMGVIRLGDSDSRVMPNKANSGRSPCLTRRTLRRKNGPQLAAEFARCVGTNTKRSVNAPPHAW